ncbi:hypothetical protein PV08_05150 [Exophiala spinifera]|uniref:Uncharacterized protein n=1 Tax=Exophiala spinifera TaxID=91928 RepID=A0A0D2BH62_9EURO|nr:uncharacterized protein PV08_05150 [Exophiala spinifera]KIW17955.1 hypothetical protein PV08_05150 [Exophiala spinifera]
MSLQLNGVAFVTGAGSGIGQACVQQLVRDGCSRIVATDINREGLARTKAMGESIRADVHIVVDAGDITDAHTVERLITLTVSTFGRLDYGLNIAGITGAQNLIPLLQPEQYDEVQHINARAVWLCERAEIAQMLTQEPLPSHDGRPGSKGSIVNVASICGLVGFPNSTPYTMSKHAVIGLVRSDSTTFANQGIRVNALCPGIIDTPLIKPEHRQFSLDYAQRFTPMGRLGTAQEIADVATFLGQPTSLARSLPLMVAIRLNSVEIYTNAIGQCVSIEKRLHGGGA